MSGCVCQGLGVYVDGEGDILSVHACEAHPLPVGEGETAIGAAALRVDQSLEAIAKVRDLLWPDGTSDVPWPADRIVAIARALHFLRPNQGERAISSDTETGAPGDGRRPAADSSPSAAMKVHQLVIIDVAFALPTSCPRCGISFETHDSLVEEGYCGTTQTCSIEYFDGRPAIDRYGVTESTYDYSLVTGYQCRRCGTSLVSTERR